MGLKVHNGRSGSSRLPAKNIRSKIMSEQNLPCREADDIYEKFIQDRGWKYKGEELKAAYERFVKYLNNVLITQDEFLTERGTLNYTVEAIKDVYNALVELVNQNKLRASEVYWYARYMWLHDAKSVVAYQVGNNKLISDWEINNCGTEVSEAEAIIATNTEWGFEASRIRIIGTPYYDATDYQFIRFDCAHMTWLWKNGSIYQAYA
jgi:hypothetical protein